MNRIILLSIIIFSNFTFAIDYPRRCFSFKSKNQRFELKPCDTIFSDGKIYKDSVLNPKTKTFLVSEFTYPDKYHWGLFDKLNNKQLYTIKNDSIFIEYLSVEISDDGKNLLFIDDYSSGYGFKNIPVVTLYNQDKFIKTFTLGDLMDNLCAVTYSASHMRWCSNWGFLNEKIFLETYDFYRFELDFFGNIIKKESCCRSSN